MKSVSAFRLLTKFSFYFSNRHNFFSGSFFCDFLELDKGNPYNMGTIKRTRKMRRKPKQSRCWCTTPNTTLLSTNKKVTLKIRPKQKWFYLDLTQQPHNRSNATIRYSRRRVFVCVCVCVHCAAENESSYMKNNTLLPFLFSLMKATTAATQPIKCANGIIVRDQRCRKQRPRQKTTKISFWISIKRTQWT